MAHETPTLKAQKRTRIGSRYAQRIRREGKLPAVIYGHKTDPVSITIDEKETMNILKRGAHVLELEVDGALKETCLVKELQFGYLGDNVIHIDFTRVNLEEEVSVSVHLKFFGNPPASTKPGAVVTHDLTDLEVICKVKDIPAEIRVDLSGLEETLTVGEIVLPPGVRAEPEPETIVARISFIAEEEVAPAGEAAAVGEEAAEPVVVSEVKAEERKKEKEGSDKE